MNRFKTKTKKVISLTFLLILTLSSILTMFPSNSVNLYENSEENEESDIIGSLLNAQAGEDPWWNVSYQWRQCINITNTGSFNLEDNIIKIQFLMSTNYHLKKNLYKKIRKCSFIQLFNR